MYKQMVYGLIIGLVAGGVIVWVIFAGGIVTTGTFIGQKDTTSGAVTEPTDSLTKTKCFELVNVVARPKTVEQKDGSGLVVDGTPIETDDTSLRQVLDEYYAWSTGQWKW